MPLIPNNNLFSTDRFLGGMITPIGVMAGVATAVMGQDKVTRGVGLLGVGVALVAHPVLRGRSMESVDRRINPLFWDARTVRRSILRDMNGQCSRPPISPLHSRIYPFSMQWNRVEGDVGMRHEQLIPVVQERALLAAILGPFPEAAPAVILPQREPLAVVEAAVLPQELIPVVQERALLAAILGPLPEAAPAVILPQREPLAVVEAAVLLQEPQNVEPPLHAVLASERTMRRDLGQWNEQLQTNNGILEKELSDLKSVLKYFASSVSELNNQHEYVVRELNDKITECENKLSNLRNKFVGVVERDRATQGNNIILNERYRADIEVKSQLYKEIAQLKTSIQSMQERLSSLEEDSQYLEVKSGELAQVRTTLAATQRKNQQLEVANQDLTEKNETMSAELRRYKANLRTNNDTLQTVCSDLNTALEEVRAKDQLVANLTEENECLKTEAVLVIKELQGENEDLKQKLHSAKSRSA